MVPCKRTDWEPPIYNWGLNSDLATHAIVLTPGQNTTGDSTAPVPTLDFHSDEEDITGHTDPTGNILCLETTCKIHASSQCAARALQHSRSRNSQDLTGPTTDAQSQFLQKQNFHITLIIHFKGNQDTTNANFACYNTSSAGYNVLKRVENPWHLQVNACYSWDAVIGVLWAFGL